MLNQNMSFLSNKSDAVGRFYFVNQEKRPVDSAKPTERLTGVALGNLEKINKFLTETKPLYTVVSEQVEIEVDGKKVKEEKLKFNEFTDKADIAKFILISGAAQKIHEAVNAKVGFFSRLLDRVWSLLTCKESQLQKINKLYAEIIKTCQAGYDKVATKDDPKTPDNKDKKPEKT